MVTAEFNPLTPEAMADPYPMYRELLAHNPVSWNSTFQTWVFTRYEDVDAILTHQQTSADRRSGSNSFAEMQRKYIEEHPEDLFVRAPTMLTADPPEHTRLRRLVSKAFTPRAVENLRPRIQSIVDEILDAVAGDGEMDLVQTVGYPLPVIVIAEMLGVPAKDRAKFKEWSDDIVATPRIVVVRDDPTLTEPTPTASPQPPSDAPIASIAIPKFAVDAAIVVLGVDDDGVMETPDGPLNVAWYDFSSRPGFAPSADGGNAVFSGHVDYYNYGPAVFWNLKDLERDDVIEVRLTDGTVYKYAVSERRTVNAETAPIQEIVGETLEEVITLITCGGLFDPNVGEYDQRVIVRATRIPDAPVGAQLAP